MPGQGGDRLLLPGRESGEHGRVPGDVGPGDRRAGRARPDRLVAGVDLAQVGLGGVAGGLGAVGYVLVGLVAAGERVQAAAQGLSHQLGVRLHPGRVEVLQALGIEDLPAGPLGQPGHGAGFLLGDAAEVGVGRGSAKADDPGADVFQQLRQVADVVVAVAVVERARLERQARVLARHVPGDLARQGHADRRRTGSGGRRSGAGSGRGTGRRLSGERDCRERRAQREACAPAPRAVRVTAACHRRSPIVSICY